MIDLPDPPIPQDVDCVGLPYMPLKVTSLLNSDLRDLSTGPEFKAAVILWCQSWTEQPAGSLPDNDRKLAAFIGVSLDEFSGLKNMALHGWIKCNDGRFYHPIICDLALNAFKNRRKQSENSAKRWAKENGAKMRSDEKPQAVGQDASSHGTEKRMQGKVREGKVRESPQTPQTDPVGSKRPSVDSLVVREFEKDGQKIPITLRECLEAEEAGDNKNPAYALPEKIRSAEVWGMAKGILRVYGLDEKAAGLVVGEMSKKHGLGADDVAKAAVIVWRAAPRSAKPYFVSVCERIAQDRRN